MTRRKILIDGGANRGLFLGAAIELLPDFEFHAFEPNPGLIERLREIPGRFPGRAISVHHGALWDRDGTISWYETDPAQDPGREGCTVMAGKTTWGVDYARPVSAPSIDFDAWLRGAVHAEDLVVLKMDIEGAEYPVLERMIGSGSIDLVDEFTVEFHEPKLDSIEPERHARLTEALRARPGHWREWGGGKHASWRREGLAPTGFEKLRTVSAEQLHRAL